jgi:hypothetical protein
MWYWELVLFCFSKSEEITIVGKGYDSKDIAQWQMENWIHDLLQKLYLFRIIKSEVKECVK